MKRCISVLLGLLLLVSLLACNPSVPQSSGTDDPPDSGIMVPGEGEPSLPPSGTPDESPDEAIDDPPAEVVLRVRRSALVLPVGRSENVEAKTENTEDALVYESGNPSVATVDALGNVTGVAEGETAVTVSCGSKAVTCAVTVGARKKSVRASEIDTSAFVNTFGRNYFANSLYCMEYVASGFEISFYGSSLSAELWADRESYLVVYADGEPTDTIRLDPGERKVYNLFEADEKGEHTVKVLKRTELLLSTVGMTGIKTEDGYFLSPPARNTRRIEVFGDSITSGYGNLGAMGTTMSPANSDGLQTYATLAAEAVGADIQVVSCSGYGLYTSRWGDGIIPPLFTKTTQNHPTRWDATRYVPDVVIVNLGTNDGANVAGNSRDNMPLFTAEAYKAAYKDFIAEIQAAYPGVQILCCFGLMGNACYEEIKSTITDMCAEYTAAGDDSVQYLFFDKITETERGCASHPNVAAHTKAAVILAARLTELFGT